MALDLNCDRCRKFIKQVTPTEAANIGENTICQECVDTAYSFRSQLEKEYKKLNGMLAGTYNKAIVQLEDIIHRALDE